MRWKVLILTLLLSFCNGLASYAQYATERVQTSNTLPHLEKRYNIFFRINSPEIDPSFQNNERAIEQMRKDIESTLALDGVVPDSLLILSTASPDGRYEFNKWLAKERAASTRKLILEMFPQFENSHIEVAYLEEDWDGLLQVLKVHTEIPQRDEMMAIIADGENLVSKEWRLRELRTGWRHIVNNYIYALRNSSITMKVVMTATNADDEFVREVIQPIDTVVAFEYTPHFPQPFNNEAIAPQKETRKYQKTILAARSNLLIPGLNVGIEIPIRENWSLGLDYYYPWFVSNANKWCVEMLGWFVDAKYWFTNDNTRWMPDSKLKGHAVGVYAGLGYYDFQNKIKGAQGEFIDLGVDYTYALPVANDKLRLEFNLGLGFLKTWYRPYTPSSDYADLIKEPGVKYRTTNFISPTKAGVSLVWPITVTTKKSPWLKMAQRQQRKTDKAAARAAKAENNENKGSK